MFIDVDGIKTEYLDYGSGTPILFLHGWGASCHIFKCLMDPLSKDHRVVSFSFPGFGQTPPPDSAWKISDYSDFTRKFIETLKLDKNSLVVVVHSFGGRVLLKLLYENPKLKIKKIVLMDAAGMKKRRTPAVSYRILKMKTVNKLFDKLPVFDKLYPHYRENMRNRYSSADYRNAKGVMKEVFKYTIAENLTPLVSMIEKPALIIWGAADTATPLSFAKYMNKHIKDSKLVVFRDGDHFAFLTHAKETVENIREFVSE